MYPIPAVYVCAQCTLVVEFVHILHVYVCDNQLGLCLKFSAKYILAEISFVITWVMPWRTDEILLERMDSLSLQGVGGIGECKAHCLLKSEDLEQLNCL